jgi:hypothetical protein
MTGAGTPQHLVDQIRRLARAGYTARRIISATGVSDNGLRAIAAKYGIVISDGRRSKPARLAPASNAKAEAWAELKLAIEAARADIREGRVRFRSGDTG